MLEGVAFAIRDCFEVAKGIGICVECSKMCGGGAKSPLWRKIMANVLNIPLELPQTEEGPGYGAAMLAMVGTGLYPDVSSCADTLVTVRETIEPDPALAARYEAQYRKFQKIYPTMKSLFQEIK